MEGEKYDYTLVREGATVIKADGTEVVLKATKIGNATILGFGQGVDPYSGSYSSYSDHTVVEGNNSWYDSSPFVKDPKTGSMHSSKEWKVIHAYTMPDTKGSYDGEIRNTWFKWSTEMDRWFWVGPHAL